MRIGIDIGGAFTDLVALDENGKITTVKVDTTPNPENGVINSIKNINLRDCKSIVHGQTLVINSIVQRKGAKVGLITTKGFRDILEIGRANRRDIYNLRYKKPVPFVPRYLRMEIDERIAANGKIRTNIKLDELNTIDKHFKKEGVESVAICLINSYANNIHEIALKKALTEKFNYKFLTASSEVTREWREYERTSTAVLNAFVQPKMVKYVSTLENTFKTEGFEGNFRIMLSNGGLASTAFVKEYPITTIESGPIGGVIGAINIVKSSEIRPDINNIITLDGGSTTTKSSLVTNMLPRVTTDHYIGRDRFMAGYPVKVPIIDVVEVGSGGTSIAYIEDNRLKVGPKAAGAYPGPACYMRGGTEPTLTDAYVVNGFIDPYYFLGGKLKLSRKAAKKSVQKLADKLNLSLEKTADGIIKLANENASYIIRLVSVQKGYDTRDFILVPFGGAGPMLAPFIAPELHIKKILIPSISLGVFSAWGMLTADLRHEQVKTVTYNLDLDNVHLIEMEFKELEKNILDIFQKEGEQRPMLIRYADMRYKGQEHTLKVELPSVIHRENIGQIQKLFHNAHEKEYTFKIETNPIEIVNLHIVGIVPTKKISIEEKKQSGDGQPKGHRAIFINTEKIEVDVYDRSNLIPHRTIEGPAIIEEDTSTIILLKSQKAYSDKFGNIIIDIKR